MVMELIEGSSLRYVLASRISKENTQHYAFQLLEALPAAHRAGKRR
jgi:serine/threonine protein kinase